MREILVRSLTSGDRLNRDCVVTEVMQQGDYVTTVTRRCTYHVESCVTVPSTPDSIRWAQTLDPRTPRQVYVTKDLEPETGRERVTYKVLGHFYVVLDREIFCVNFRHILSMVVNTAQEFCDS
jgi:hypothetical protein